jgi:hypothetical protein
MNNSRRRLPANSKDKAMRKLMGFAVIVLIGQLLAGCELIAAGVIGAEIEKQHRQYCYYHRGRC